MKQLITNYTFSAANRQVTFTDFANITLEQVLLITNVTDGIIIYNFASPSLGGSAASNVLTVEYDTTSMNDGDDIQVFYDVPTDFGTGNVTTTGTQRVVLQMSRTGALFEIPKKGFWAPDNSPASSPWRGMSCRKSL